MYASVKEDPRRCVVCNILQDAEGPIGGILLCVFGMTLKDIASTDEYDDVDEEEIIPAVSGDAKIAEEVIHFLLNSFSDEDIATERQ